MFVYWTMFVVPAFYAMFARSPGYDRRRASQLGLGLVLLAFTLLIGLRFQVGGDWFRYEEIIADIAFWGLADALTQKDPGFGFIAWLSQFLGLGGYGASLFCGGALVYGLWQFSKRQSNPWMVIASSVPYLIIVVGMGYVKQAAALGFVLAALTRISDRSAVPFLKWTALAVPFHASAILVLPLFGFALLRQRLLVIVPITILAFISYYLVIRDRLGSLLEGYIVQEMDSSGAAIRLLMNTLPSVLFLIYRKRFSLSKIEMGVWTGFSIASITLFVALYFSPASTALDRVGIYLIPIQLFVFGNLSSALSKDFNGQRLIDLLVILFYGAILFVWLNYATHAEYWLPYRFAPLEG